MKAYLVVFLLSVLFACDHQQSRSWSEYLRESEEFPGFTSYSFIGKRNGRVTSEMYLFIPSEWKSFRGSGSDYFVFLMLKNQTGREEIIILLWPDRNQAELIMTETSPPDLKLEKMGENRWILIDSEYIEHHSEKMRSK